MIANSVTFKRLWTVLPAGGALLLLSAIAVAPAHAAPNSLRVVPADVTVAAGATTQVKLVAEPPAATLAVWVIDVTFDPAVITATSRGCDPLDTPSGAVGAGGCVVVDTNGDGLLDTARLFGGVVYSGSGEGLSKQSTLADIVFTGAGGPGRCSTVRVTVKVFGDPGGREMQPEVTDGRLCMEGTLVPGETLPPGDTGGPPPSGASPGGASDAPGASPGGLSPGVEPTGAAGASPGRTGGSATTGGSPGAVRSPVGGGTAAVGQESGDSGGFSVAVWLVLGGLVVAALGGSAWWLVRKRSRPAEGGSGDSDDAGSDAT